MLAFCDDACESQSLYAADDVRDLWQFRASLNKRKPGQVDTIEIEEVEGVEDELVLWMRASVLKRLESGPTFLIQRNDLTIYGCGFSIQA